MPGPIGTFANTYARLPERFFARVAPGAVADPRLIIVNRPLAAELGLAIDALDEGELAAIFSGNRIPPGAEPISMAYAGHQFGHFVAQLGDGRAVLLGEVLDRAGSRRDIQLKGAGRTPFSRNGDGRAALGPVLREYLLSEAMHALGVPSTRGLAAVTTGETVVRECPLPGAVFTRVAASHIRVGTFQYFAARGDTDALERLAGAVMDRHYPQARESGNPNLALLELVARRQASLVAHWMSVGFIHGVMNTDNMAVSGETIDFGPCAFLEAYDPEAVFSAIDTAGRYAFRNQPQAAHWNIARFAEALLPLIDADAERAAAFAQQVVVDFPAWLDREWIARMCAKIGIDVPQDADRQLLDGLLDLIHRNQADFTLTFRRLCDWLARTSKAGGGEDAPALFADSASFDIWAESWRRRLQSQARCIDDTVLAMRNANPALIPRNHLVQRAIQAAEERQDFGPFFALLDALASPFDAPAPGSPYIAPALPAERVERTFCGT